MPRKRKLNEIIKIKGLSFLLKAFFKFEEMFLSYKRINYPKTKPCIFALWHAHQCLVYCDKDKERLYVLVSKSNDGEIIAAGAECMGIKTIRGSKGRNGVEATINILEKLEQGNSVGITIDGPRGPAKVVKDGVINIAKLSQVPIVPVVWYSPESTFIKFNTWDKFTIPFLKCNIMVLYGDPIYIPSDLTKDDVNKYRLIIENKLKELYEDIKANYHQYKEQKDLD